MIRKLYEGGMFQDDEADEDKILATVQEMKRQGMTMKIAIEWGAEDVLSLDDSLSPDQVEDVLTYMERKHDANIGINWDFIQFCIDSVKEN